MNRLDPRSPLVFDTRELSRRPGSMREVSRRIEAPAVLGTDVIAVADHDQPGDDACLFCLSDIPVMRALGLYREQAFGENGGQQPIV